MEGSLHLASKSKAFVEQIDIGVFSIQYSVLERRNRLEACPNLVVFAADRVSPATPKLPKLS